MTNYNNEIKKIVKFQGASLKNVLKQLETDYINNTKISISKKNTTNDINISLLESAFTIKAVISKLYIIIHAVGILISLPHILLKDEKVKSLSLGAGNTGKEFDLETNKRIAEFKFITWQNKSNTIRQNSVFKDFYYLAEKETNKKKYLYVFDKTKVIEFFESDRSIKSILGQNKKLTHEFNTKFNNRYKTISEYYSHRKKSVNIVDLNKKIANLSQIINIIK